MKLWIDDVRPAPDNYTHVFSVNAAIVEIEHCEKERDFFLSKANNALNNHDLQGYKTFLEMAGRRDIEIIDIDHDAGDFYYDGGDYIRLLDWLEMTGRSYPIHIHSANSVGVANMRLIIEKNGWKEIR